MSKPVKLAEARALEWDTARVVCRNHPDRRCQRSKFVRDNHRVCGWCAKTPAARRTGWLAYVDRFERTGVVEDWWKVEVKN